MTAGIGHGLRKKSDWKRIFRSMVQCGYIYLYDEIISMDDERH